MISPNGYIPPSVLEGRCQCEQVRYRIAGTPLTLFACHCKDCQRQSASAFGMALWIDVQNLKLVAGRLQDWVRTTPSGRTMVCQFCPQCGVRIFHRLTDQPRIVSVKPGTLDDTRWLRPAGHIWTRSAQPWSRPDACLLYDENPDSFDALMQAWQSTHEAHAMKSEVP